MQSFIVDLTRAYRVEIEAEDEQSASELVEYYLGGPADLSTEKDREERKFRITGMEMVINEGVLSDEQGD